MIPTPISIPQHPANLFADLYQDEYAAPGQLLYGLMLALARHRRLGLKQFGYPTQLADLIRALRYDRRFKTLVADLQTRYFEREVWVSLYG